MLKKLHYPFFTVQLNTAINGEDLKNLRKFYAPILGSNSILLYEYLRDLTNISSYESGIFDFDSLTYLLNMDIKILNDARIKLESVALLSTLIDEYNRKTVFVLEKPLDSSGFRKNLLLANKLIQTMGKQNFERLMGKEKNAFLSKAKYLLDASAKFDDVFASDNNLDCEFSNSSMYEIDSRDVDTSEINFFIQEKLDLNTFEFPNPYEAILKTDSRFFFSQVSGQIPDENIVNLIKYNRSMGFHDSSINLIFYYTYESNGKIIYSYVKKVLSDLLNKNKITFEDVEKQLDLLFGNKNKSVLGKKELFKATYLQSLSVNNSKYRSYENLIED
ncbi:DnaD domain protein [Mycoplasma tauri]|uniref:DnaD domain protein n=1 Tax=Mycoplasma tauri TaxID=547987 RepID=A0A953NER6_9MOLU|nr:DnaD domain protein [Mycoplasma tauri]MBZ4195593.1 DnaD domain protein [Mycoplasma tauri]MBZ4203385.1 DnaD domain protein [Mycoplasma tauri]MBZ4204242.1 DnaD domain protein [Mycoplasma tauri]MBZ4218036.1 DnaD domain protein [Mycoplasma tauri]MBZ4226618.1 DnaD domain protein [Mycoplasma tauri]